MPALASRSRPNAAIISALRDQHLEKALALLHTALIQSPGNAQLWTMQGVAYDGAGNKKEALNSFRQALKLSRDDLPALQGAAQIEFDAGDIAGIPFLEHLLRLRPSDVTGHGILAVLQYQQGDSASAVVHFEKAAALFDSTTPALLAYGSCLVKLKRLEKAADVFSQTLALGPLWMIDSVPHSLREVAATKYPKTITVYLHFASIESPSPTCEPSRNGAIHA